MSGPSLRSSSTQSIDSLTIPVNEPIMEKDNSNGPITDTSNNNNNNNSNGPITDMGNSNGPITDKGNSSGPITDTSNSNGPMSQREGSNDDNGRKSTESPNTSGLNGRYPSITPSMVEFGRIPKAPRNIQGNHKTMPSRENSQLKQPNQMKTPTVTMMNRRPRAAALPTAHAYDNYVQSKRPKKVITWDEASNARPPLRIDMEGPTPCSYSPRNKPLYETNAPMWSLGRRTFVEKSGGARTSWQKTWFQNGDVWTQKSNFFSDRRWPAPPTYKQKAIVGEIHATLHSAPHHTFGYRRQPQKGKEGAPAPNDYDLDKADPVVLPKSPAYSHSLRHGGTCLWPTTEETPGPGRYMTETSFRRVKTHFPSFSIRGSRREQNHQLGPFAAF